MVNAAKLGALRRRFSNRVAIYRVIIAPGDYDENFNPTTEPRIVGRQYIGSFQAESDYRPPDLQTLFRHWEGTYDPR